MPDEDTLLTQPNTDAQGVEQQADNDSQTEETKAQDADGTQNEESNAATENEDADTENQEAGAPDEYETFVVPEGYGVDETVLNEYQDWAKELELSQEQAQAGVNLVAKMQEAQAEKWVEQQKTWVDDAKSDKEIGGESFDQNVATAVKARDAFGNPEFSEMLDSSGLGNHPEMIRFLNRVGKAISEDRVVVGGTNVAPQTRESLLYPSMQQ